MRVTWCLGIEAGDIVIVAPPGEFGKPRPAVIIQAGMEFVPERVTVALITSDLQRLPALRVPVPADISAGLRRPSEIAIDNLQTFSMSKIGEVVGTVPSFLMSAVEQALRRHLGL